jgi:hypothetical protein
MYTSLRTTFPGTPYLSKCTVYLYVYSISVLAHALIVGVTTSIMCMVLSALVHVQLLPLWRMCTGVCAIAVAYAAAACL